MEKRTRILSVTKLDLVLRTAWGCSEPSQAALVFAVVWCHWLVDVKRPWERGLSYTCWDGVGSVPLQGRSRDAGTKTAGFICTLTLCIVHPESPDSDSTRAPRSTRNPSFCHHLSESPQLGSRAEGISLPQIWKGTLKNIWKVRVGNAWLLSDSESKSFIVIVT